MQHIGTSETTVAALAAEFGLGVDDTLDMCHMFGVPAIDASSPLNAVGAALLRGIARGEIDPEEALASETAAAAHPAVVQAMPTPPILAPVVPKPMPIEPASTETPAGQPPAGQRTRRAAGEDLPEVHTTSWWGRHFRGGQRFDRYVPRWLRVVYLLSVVAVLALLWWAVGVVGGGTEQSNALFPAAPDLTVGACFNADPGLWLDTVQVVPCAGPHDAQAAAIVELTPPARAYPELPDLRSEATVLCADRVREQVALEGAENIGVSVPSASVWRGGDQRVLCSVVHEAGEKLVGSSL